MKKILLFIATVFLTMGAMAQNAVEFTFTRNGNGANVEVNGKEGVTASITATSASNAWNAGGAMAGNSNVLCQNTNTSATSESSPITYTLTVEGLNKHVTGVAFTHIAVNSGGNLQPSNDVDIRHCNFKLEANDNLVGRITDENIWIPSGKTEKTISFDGLAVEANGTLTIKLTLYKGTNNDGCFYGLTKITVNFLSDFYHPGNKNLTAAELMTATKPTYIAIKGLANKNNEYWNYVSGEAKTSTQYFKQNAIFVWEPVNNGVAGSYYLRKVNSGYMQASNPGAYAETKEGAAVFTAVKPTEVASGANGEGQFNRDDKSDGYIEAAGGSDYIVRFVTNGKWLNIGDRETSSQAPAFNNGYGTFTIYQICELEGFAENINVTIKNTGDVDYATFYSNAPVQLPQGVTAYYVKENGINNGYVTLTADEDGIIAGNTGVILATTVDESVQVALTVLGENEATESGNLLKGSVEETEIGENCYVLANGDNGIGFYGVEEGVSGANKAYLEVPATEGSAAFYGFLFEGTTGVENVEVENGAQVIFDLTGRRIESINAAGIYIVNGKKVLVK